MLVRLVKLERFFIVCMYSETTIIICIMSILKVLSDCKCNFDPLFDP